MDHRKLYRSLIKFAKTISEKNIPKPQFKFLCEMLLGMLSSNTLVVTEIARCISHVSDFNSTYKRINRNLNYYSIENMQKAAERQNFDGLTKEHIIAVDLGDITKPYAEQMEHISRVADGSDDHKIKNGYWLLGAVAINPISQDKVPIPLCLKIFSTHEVQHKSENTLVMSLFKKTAKKFENQRFEAKPAIVVDRGGDRGILLNVLIEKDLPFVVRLCQRNVIDLTVETERVIRIGKRTLERESLPYETIIKRVENTNKTEKFEIRYDFKKIAIRDLPSERDLYLVTAWSKYARKPMEILTNRPVKTFEDARQIIANYLSRWSVEETYKFLKKCGLEKVRSLNFFAIKNLIGFAFLASVFLARTVKYEIKFIDVVKKYHQTLRHYGRNLFNWLYPAIKVCALLLRQMVQKIKPPGRRIDFFSG